MGLWGPSGGHHSGLTPEWLIEEFGADPAAVLPLTAEAAYGTFSYPWIRVGKAGEWAFAINDSSVDLEGPALRLSAGTEVVRFEMGASLDYFYFYFYAKGVTVASFEPLLAHGLGANTEDYYSVLAHTGHGSWRPRHDPHLWLTFNLRAHHMQAQTMARRVDEARRTWDELDALAREHGLPERTLDAMFDAVLGYRVRRGGYMKRAEVTEQTATRDLAALVSAGALSARGNGRGRHYVGARKGGRQM